MNKPKAVIINDIHYNLKTLPLADAALRQAINKSNELKIPLIIAGDLHDSKANIRGECANAMIETLKTTYEAPYYLIGNHCKIHEKGEEHAMHFLDAYCRVYDRPAKPFWLDYYLVPYDHDPENLRAFLKTVPEGSTLIMHQGIEGSNAGDYIQDRSAIRPEDVSGFRVISGHYHTRQDIKLPNGGLWTYTGNPYTLSWGEANDPEKGFHVLYDDGTLEFIPTNLRRHILVEVYVSSIDDFLSDMVTAHINPEDLVWLKVRGSPEELAKYSKKEYSMLLKRDSYKLTLIPTDSEIKSPEIKENVSQADILDAIIDSAKVSDEQKTRVKELWRNNL